MPSILAPYCTHNIYFCIAIPKPLGWSLLSLVDFPSHLSTWLQSASGADHPVWCFCEPPCRLLTSLLQHTVPLLTCLCIRVIPTSLLQHTVPLLTCLCIRVILPTPPTPRDTANCSTLFGFSRFLSS
jgi:hypothetical protein